MYCLINKENKMIGFAKSKFKNSVETDSLKPVNINEDAIWNGKEFDYKFQQPPLCEETPFDYAKISSMLLGEMSRFIKPLNGTETRQHNGDISVLIPCYKQSAFIKRAINSCNKQYQKPKEILVLLMDEESYLLKEELESNKEIKVTCFKDKQMCSSKARTYLSERCKTDWLIFLDADDELRKNYIQELDRLDGAVCIGSFIRVSEDGKEYGKNRTTIASNSPVHCIIQNSTCLMHKDFFRDIGQKDEFSSGGEDMDMFLRALKQRKWKFSYTFNTHYIYHTEGKSNVLTKELDSFLTSHFNAFVANKDFFIKELEDIHHKNCYIKKMIWLLKNFTTENIHSFINTTEKIFFDWVYFQQRFVNVYNEKMLASRLRKTENVYRREDYISINNTFVNDVGLLNRNVDVVFFNCNNTYNIEKFIKEEKNILIHKNVYAKLKEQNLAPIDEIFWLLDNYSCFEIDCEKYAESFQQECHSELENEILKNNLTEELKQIFNFVVLKNAEDFFTTIPPKRKDIVLDLTTGFGEDILYENFDKILTTCEERFTNGIYPKLIDGDVNFSEEFQNKIVKRLKNYRDFVIYNKGGRNDIIHNSQNAFVEISLQNWEDVYKEKVNNSIYVIKAGMADADKLKEFLKNNETYSFYVKPNDENIKTKSDVVDFIRKYEGIFEKEYHNLHVFQNITEVMADKNLTHIRNNCKYIEKIIHFDCSDACFRLCKKQNKKYNLSELNSFDVEQITECDYCFIPDAKSSGCKK